MKRTTIWLGDEDREAIRTVRHRYGVASDSDAIRLALRILAQAKEVAIAPLPSRAETDEEVTSGQTRSG